MSIYLLDDSLKVDICFEENDSDYDDNICVSIREECPDEERIFRYDETNIYLTPAQAAALAEALTSAATASRRCTDPETPGG